MDGRQISKKGQEWLLALSNLPRCPSSFSSKAEWIHEESSRSNKQGRGNQQSLPPPAPPPCRGPGQAKRAACASLLGYPSARSINRSYSRSPPHRSCPRSSYRSVLLLPTIMPVMRHRSEGCHLPGRSGWLGFLQEQLSNRRPAVGIWPSVPARWTDVDTALPPALPPPFTWQPRPVRGRRAIGGGLGAGLRGQGWLQCSPGTCATAEMHLLPCLNSMARGNRLQFELFPFASFCSGHS